MTTWLLLAIAAQFLSAMSVLIDKHIVVRAEHVGKPVVYAFYVSLLSGFVIVLVPFGIVEWHRPGFFLLALFNSAAFVAAIIFLYSALARARAADVAPVVGAVSALATVLLAYLWIDGDATHYHIFSVLFLIVGTALISHFHFEGSALALSFAAGVAFGATAFSAKLVFLETSFLDGFFWTRFINLLLALSFLLIPQVRAQIFHGARHASRAAASLVVGNKIIGGVASVLTAFAISLGSVSVVNSLAGLQFVFLFILTFLFARLMPHSRHAHAHPHTHHLSLTGVGVTLIVIGLALLAFESVSV